MSSITSSTQVQIQAVESTMKRIIGHKGVKALIVINRDGLPLNVSMEMNGATEQLIQNIHELTIAARRMVRDIDPKDDLLFLRTCSTTDEILISPDVGFSVVVIQELADQPVPAVTNSSAS